jgi:protein involved in polysaccharide export with SLBB domain
MPYQPNLTVERAIALGGGFTELASRRRIEVIRATDPAHKPVRVKLSDPVFPGDVINVKPSFF